MADSSSQGGSKPQSRPRRRLIPRPQVFISFRGDDVRNCFLRTVVIFLGSRKINWFTDTRLPVGENLEELFTEIKKSKIAIVIFSKRYSDSKWCMEELSKIDELAREGKLKVIPVYYNVSPSDVKHLQGEFGESFERLKNIYEIKEPEKVVKWKASVESIAKRKGLLSYTRGNVAPPLISEIVVAVIACLNKMPGGKVKPLDTKMTTIHVVFLAFVAALFCRYLISPLFFNNADFFNNGKWLFGVPTAAAFWFHINKGNDQNSPPPGTTRPTPSNTEPPPPPGTGPTPSSFKSTPPPPRTEPPPRSGRGQTSSSFEPPPTFTRPTPSSNEPPPPPPPPFTRTIPSSFIRRPPPRSGRGKTSSRFEPPPSFTRPTPSSFEPPPSFTRPTPSSYEPPPPPPPFTKTTPSSFIRRPPPRSGRGQTSSSFKPPPSFTRPTPSSYEPPPPPPPSFTRQTSSSFEPPPSFTRPTPSSYEPPPPPPPFTRTTPSSFKRRPPPPCTKPPPTPSS